MGLWFRLFSAECARLNAELIQSNAQRDWWESQARAIGAERLTAKADLKAEINRNRKREDAFTNIVLGLETGKHLPKRIEEPRPEDVEEKPVRLSTAQDLILQERAREYCDQRPEAEFDNVYARMKEDPEEWLRD